MENLSKRRFFLGLLTHPTEKELALFKAFVRETLSFKRLQAIDLIDNFEAIGSNGNGLLPTWTALFKEILKVFPVRAFVRICGKRLLADPAFVAHWGPASWGKDRHRVMICSTLEEAEVYLDTLMEKEPLQHASLETLASSVLVQNERRFEDALSRHEGRDRSFGIRRQGRA